MKVIRNASLVQVRPGPIKDPPQGGVTISSFLDDLFGGLEGIIYAPVKDRTWEQHFFEWPNERAKLERHLDDFQHRDVYISPVLFSEKRISPETFKGTKYLWTEFDGTVPTSTIEPTMRVMSSQMGHEHWYWKLDHFETDKTVVEDLTKRIAYAYGADLSVWDYQNVLRPIDTWNHKRNKPVTLVSKTEDCYSIERFRTIPSPPNGSSVAVLLGDLPTRDAIIAKYDWQSDALELMSKVIKKGEADRSNAMMRLAYEAAEVGCSNEEIFVLIEERDRVWGKFVGRTDRQKRLEGIIASVRKRKAINAEITHGTPEVYRFHDFMSTNINLEWAIESVLPVAGSMVIFGSPGVGKTTFSLRLAIDLALGKERFLLWPIPKKQRILFLSLEMQHYELKEFFTNMELSTPDQLGLQEQLYIWPIGTAYPLDTPDEQRQLLKYIKLHKIDLIVIDSLSLSMYGSVKDDDDVKRLNSFLNEDVRRDLKCGYIFIHHPRKRSNLEQKDEITQDDVFGSRYIAANAQTIMTIAQRHGSPRMHIKFLKRRFSEGPDELEIERTDNRGFSLVGQHDSPSPTQGVQGSNKERVHGVFGPLF
jgi:archaellum biogenesis ATPase FlaH